MTTSGVVCNDRLTWTTFHSSYDFGYMMKVLTNNVLPKSEPEFLAAMKLYFPVVYDLKVMSQTKQGLSKLGDDYKVRRYGITHQAGSDSLLTVETYQAFIDANMGGKVDEKYRNQIAGLKPDRTTDYYAHMRSQYVPHKNNSKILICTNSSYYIKRKPERLSSSSPLPATSNALSSNSGAGLATANSFQPGQYFSSSTMGPPQGLPQPGSGSLFYPSQRPSPSLQTTGVSFNREYPYQMSPYPQLPLNPAMTSPAMAIEYAAPSGRPQHPFLPNNTSAPATAGAHPQQRK